MSRQRPSLFGFPEYMVFAIFIAVAVAFVFGVVSKATTPRAMRYELVCTIPGGTMTIVTESTESCTTSDGAWYCDKLYIQAPGQLCWVREIPR